MRLQDFLYDLPPELIAQAPLFERSASRLLHLDRASHSITHRQFKDLPSLLSAKDLMVFNNTRVIPARLFGQKMTGGKIEILVERVVSSQQFWAHLRASKSPLAGSYLLLTDGSQLKVLGRKDDLFELELQGSMAVFDKLEQLGHIPLPPYIERADTMEDKERYQTVFAERKGAVAAPTAGLHFDKAMLQQLTAQGIVQSYVTLHVGAGTFQPVRTENILEHKMHAEWIEVSQELCDSVNTYKNSKGRVVAIGTTVARALETAAQAGEIKPYVGETSIFIYPSYEFKCVDVLLTNFHLPGSTLLMLVCAFGGYELMMRAYHEAVKEKYRFFSYGDAMLIT